MRLKLIKLAWRSWRFQPFFNSILIIHRSRAAEIHSYKTRRKWVQRIPAKNSCKLHPIRCFILVQINTTNLLTIYCLRKGWQCTAKRENKCFQVFAEGREMGDRNVLQRWEGDFCVSHNVVLYHVMGNKLLSYKNAVFELFAIH
jgi:hypothetical protein